MHFSSPSVKCGVFSLPLALQVKPKSALAAGGPAAKLIALLRTLYQYGVPLLGVSLIAIVFMMLSG